MSNKTKINASFIISMILLVSSLIVYTRAVQIASQPDNSGYKYHLDVPVPVADMYVGQFSNGTYFAVNGSNWQTFAYSTNASATINNALGNLTSGRTWQEKVVLSGNFIISSPIYISPFTVLDLTGAKITLAAGSNCDMITTNSSSYNVPFGTVAAVEVFGGFLDGNEAGQSSTSNIINFNGNGTTDWSIHDMILENPYGYCLSLKYLGIVHMHDVMFIAAVANGNGLYLLYVFDSTFNNLVFADWGNSVYLDSGTVTNVFSNIFLGGGSGITLNSASKNQFSNIHAEDSYAGCIQIINGNYNTFSGGMINNPSGVQASSYDGFLLSGTSNHNIISNFVFSSIPSAQPKYDVEEQNTADYNNVVGCILLSGLHLIGANSGQSNNLQG